jgi:hypothetical protein
VARAGGGGGAGTPNGSGPGQAGGGNGARVGEPFSCCNSLATPAAANSGSGGGGGGNYNYDRVANFPGGAGGSGIVILRYPSARSITLGAGLTGSTVTVGADKVTTITAGTGTVSFS